MSLQWTDVLEIAIQLAESKPDVDPRYVNFVDLHNWVVGLPEACRSLPTIRSAAARRCSKPSSWRGWKRLTEPWPRLAREGRGVVCRRCAVRRAGTHFTRTRV
ncbi:hypothetical protein D3C84_106540 [compost metagenome]